MEASFSQLKFIARRLPPPSDTNPAAAMPARRAKAKAKAGDACDDLQCDCCLARRTGRACADLGDLRLRFGSTRQAVFGPGATRVFWYTYGAELEFLIKDVPRERVPEAQAMLTYLVERTRSGHPALHGHRVLSGFSWRSSCAAPRFMKLWRPSARPVASISARCCCSQRCRQYR